MRSLEFALAFLLLTGLAAAQEQVSFLTPDGYRLHADLYGAGDRAVLLVHGGRFNKESWDKQAQTLAKAGFRVLAIDFRGYGQTVAGTQTTDDKSYPDVLAAIRYLRANGVKSVSVVGASMGGDAAADAAVDAHPGEIDRIIFLASDGGSAPERLQGRKLFIFSRNDQGSDGLRSRAISEHYSRAPEPKKMIVLEGSAHAQFIFESAQGSPLMKEMLSFLSEP
jgi:dienelactone hydrolase